MTESLCRKGKLPDSFIPCDLCNSKVPFAGEGTKEDLAPSQKEITSQTNSYLDTLSSKTYDFEDKLTKY